MFSRSSRSRLSSRSVSAPHLSGSHPRAPPARRERPGPASLRPAAAHLWPQVSGPCGGDASRARPSARRHGRGYVGPPVRRERGRDPWPCVSRCGDAREALSLASSLQADLIPGLSGSSR